MNLNFVSDFENTFSKKKTLFHLFLAKTIRNNQL